MAESKSKRKTKDGDEKPKKQVTKKPKKLEEKEEEKSPEILPEKEKEKEKEKEEEEEDVSEKSDKKGSTKPVNKFEGSNLYSIGAKKYANVNYFKGNLYINFRDFYDKDGKMTPGKGIALTEEQYKVLKDLIPTLDAEVAATKKK